MNIYKLSPVSKEVIKKLFNKAILSNYHLNYNGAPVSGTRNLFL